MSKALIARNDSVAAGSARAFSEQLPEKDSVERFSSEIVFHEVKEVEKYAGNFE